MNISVRLSPIHFLYIYFFILRIIINKSKVTTFSIQMDMIITSLFWKLTKYQNSFLDRHKRNLWPIRNTLSTNPYLSTNKNFYGMLHYL